MHAWLGREAPYNQEPFDEDIASRSPEHPQKPCILRRNRQALPTRPETCGKIYAGRGLGCLDTKRKTHMLPVEAFSEIAAGDITYVF